MISSFNIGKLTSLLKDFYTVSHIRITIFDENFSEIACYPQRRAPFCELIRADDAGRSACSRCDERACRIAAKKHDTYIYVCHAGMKEAIMPIYMSNLVIGYLLFGHVLSYPDYETAWTQISKKCIGYDVDPGTLKTACMQQPLISEEYILSASNIMSAIAIYLCMERMITLRNEDLPVQIDSYIQEHLTEDIDAKAICEVFQIGKTRLYEIARESYGMGIAQLIRSLRIEKAKSLLQDHTGLTISEVASLCGFHDYNYFITVFKRVAGMTPGQFAAVPSSANSS